MNTNSLSFFFNWIQSIYDYYSLATSERQASIGVLFAIVGNIFISIALNVQKSVHNQLAFYQEQEKTCPKYNKKQEQQTQEEQIEQTSFLFMDNSLDATQLVTNTSHNTHQNESDYDGDDYYHGDDFDGFSSEDSRLLLLDQNHAEPFSDRNYLKEKRWWLGIALMTLGELGNFTAYGFASAVLVAPLGTVALISNAIIAPIFLGEEIRKQDIFGIAFATLGTVFIVLVSSQTEEPAWTPQDLIIALQQTSFRIYFLLTLTIAGVLLYLSKNKFGKDYLLIDLGLVAIFGGYTVLSTKGISGLLTNPSLDILNNFVLYILVFILALTAVLQIKYLNQALSRFDSIQVIPTNFVLFTISSIVGSAVLYNDFEHMSRQSTFISFIAITLMFIGVYLITSRAVKELPTFIQVYDVEQLLDKQLYVKSSSRRILGISHIEPVSIRSSQALSYSTGNTIVGGHLGSPSFIIPHVIRTDQQPFSSVSEEGEDELDEYSKMLPDEEVEREGTGEGDESRSPEIRTGDSEPSSPFKMLFGHFPSRFTTAPWSPLKTPMDSPFSITPNTTSYLSPTRKSNGNHHQHVQIQHTGRDRSVTLFNPVLSFSQSNILASSTTTNNHLIASSSTRHLSLSDIETYTTSHKNRVDNIDFIGHHNSNNHANQGHDSLNHSTNSSIKLNITKRLSSVFQSVGTREIRKLEFGHMSNRH